MSKMQPDKKNEKVLYTSTPAPTRERTKFIDDKDLSEISITLPNKQNTLRKRITIELVIKALQEVGNKRKGASFVSIKKYLSAIPDGPDLSQPRTKASLKKVIIKALEDGVLKRSSQHPNAKGVTGSFLISSLPKKTLKSPTKDKLKKTKASSAKVSTANEIAPGPSKTATKKEKPIPKSNKAKSSEDLTEKQKKNTAKVPKTAVVKKGLNKKKPATNKSEKQPVEESTAETKIVKNEVDGNKAPKQKKNATFKQDQVLENKIQTEKKSKIVQKRTDLPAKSEINLKRKDLSDTELELSRRPPMQLKSYSSDTELETSRKLQNVKKVTKPKKVESKFLKKNRKDETSKTNLEADVTGPDNKETFPVKKSKQTVKKR